MDRDVPTVLVEVWCLHCLGATVTLGDMAEEPDNIVLRYPRRIDEKLDLVQADVRELKNRVGILEQQYAPISSRVDRIENRLERIERRLDLAEADH
jgi:predicted  nucleic acid-binding Zn-ribbon protein